MKSHPLYRIIRYVRPYWAWTAAAVIAALVFAVCSGASIGMLLPFFDDIFARSEEQVQRTQDLLPLLQRDVLPEFSGFFESLFTLDMGAVGERAEAIGTGFRASLRTARPDQALLAIILTILLLILLKNLTVYLQVFFQSHVQQGIIRDVRAKLFEHLLLLDMSFYSEARTGEILSRLTADVDRLKGALTETLINLVKQVALLLVFLGLAVWASWKLALITLLVMPPSMMLILLVGRALRKRSHRSQEQMADFASILQEVIQGIRIVKAFSMEIFENRRFKRMLGTHCEYEIDLRRLKALAAPLTEVLGAIACAVILWFGGREVIAGGGMSAGRFFVFLGATLSMMDPVKNLSKANARIQGGLASAERVFAILDRKPMILDSENPVRLDDLQSEIVYEDVCFEYVGDEPVLRHINLRIAKGEVVALVGPSGGGKSTLADLLPRFYDPTSGRVLIDGMDIRTLEISSLRRLMGIVTQETALFNDTVRNNIAYGEGEIEMDRIIQATKVANALEFVEQLPLGFDTVIGERGMTLSGGQRQRLAIARAVLKDPSILIFDEATSSLDTHSERQVQKAIDGLLQGRTALVIAHRLSTVTKADRIAYVEEGRILEEGTHQDLIALDGHYKKLHDMQFTTK
ncbi:ATP-binding cassette domain-containing protein [Candidatus Fermentibacteria bacterium]|nr:ATP-binding cassette domain-containing protein [Candidatus Fermentibacteria bacterium]